MSKKNSPIHSQKHPEFVGVFFRLAHLWRTRTFRVQTALNVFANGVLKPAVLFFRFVCFH